MEGVHMYYQGTITAIRKAIREKVPGVISTFSKLEPNKLAPPSHLLWMCDEIQRMNVKLDSDAIKAARSIGWILRDVEIHGIWDNDKSRLLVRCDVLEGLDKAHIEIVEYQSPK